MSWWQWALAAYAVMLLILGWLLYKAPEMPEDYGEAP